MEYDQLSADDRLLAAVQYYAPSERKYIVHDPDRGSHIRHHPGIRQGKPIHLWLQYSK